MSKNLFVSYDLYAPGQNYQRVAEAIKQLGSWAKVHRSLWYVRSNYDVSAAAAFVWKVMDRNDSLIVVDATSNDATWYNLDLDVSQFLLDQWRLAA